MIRLRVEREKLKLSQSRLAALTGTVHPSSISQIETGKRKPGYKQRDLIEKAMIAAGWLGNNDLFEEVN